MKNTFGILEIVDALGIERKDVIGDNFNAKCPFCNHKRFLLNCNVERDIYRCNGCGTHGGAVDLYSRVVHGAAYERSMREEIIPEIEKLLGRETRREKPRSVNPEGSRYPELSDTELDALHKRLFSLKMLRLSKEDRDSLLKRGLSDGHIRTNGYRSYRMTSVLSNIPSQWKENYGSPEWQKAKNKNPILKRMSRSTFLAALAVGRAFCQMDPKMTPEGMAGAFCFQPSKKESYWGIRLYDGILIPIRNASGEIVAAQIRSSRPDGSKYMLLSSAGMPKGRKGRTRIHHPLQNLLPPRKGASAAILTEGPLKSDVYSFLDPDAPYQVFALIGVQTTSSLVEELKTAGITHVFEALDMDKLLKPQVLAAERKIKQMCLDTGIGVSNLVWAPDAAKTLANQYYSIGKENGVELPPEKSSSPYLALAWLTTALSGAKVEVPDALRKWPPASKGIDDIAYQSLRDRLSQDG